MNEDQFAESAPNAFDSQNGHANYSQLTKQPSIRSVDQWRDAYGDDFPKDEENFSSKFLPFKQKKTLQQRKVESRNIRTRFPNKIPVIVERYNKEKTLPQLDKTKYLVPQDLILSQFMAIIRNRLRIPSSHTFYLLVNNKSIVTMMASMGQIYNHNKDEDGFLYMTYASQEMFG